MDLRWINRAELWTIEDVAKYLKVSKMTIFRMLKKESIPGCKIGHQWRFRKEEIDEWLKKNNIQKNFSEKA